MTTLVVLYLAIAAIPAVIAMRRGLSEGLVIVCLLGALATSWTLIGWFVFMALAVFETPLVSIRTSVSIISTDTPQEVTKPS